MRRGEGGEKKPNEKRACLEFAYDSPIEYGRFLFGRSVHISRIIDACAHHIISTGGIPVDNGGKGC